LIGLMQGRERGLLFGLGRRNGGESRTDGTDGRTLSAPPPENPLSTSGDNEGAWERLAGYLGGRPRFVDDVREGAVGVGGRYRTDGMRFVVRPGGAPEKKACS
jgi:hypothetical protein